MSGLDVLVCPPFGLGIDELPDDWRIAYRHAGTININVGCAKPETSN